VPDREHGDIDDVIPLIRSKEMLDLLVRNGLDVSRPTRDGFTPLILAVESHNHERARWLIEAGADVNTPQQGWGFTALEKALDSGDQEMFHMLTAKQATGVFVTAENGSAIMPNNSAELAAVTEYLRAFVAEDAATLREVTDNWPADFFQSFTRGLYRGSKTCPQTFVQGFSNGKAATIFMTCSGRSEVWTYTLVNRDGKWKVRREAQRG
jgi:ankyrin repeat protein